MKRNCIAICGSLLLAAVTGMISNSAADELPKLKEKKTYKIGFSQTESNNPWRLAETQSVKDEAAKRATNSFTQMLLAPRRSRSPTLTA
jgi:ABC-type sugar transport system substrate-binding protein